MSSSSLISVGGPGVTANTFNISAGLGGGNFLVGNQVASTATVNLNATGDLNVGATITAYSNISGGAQAILNVNVAAGNTGYSGGIISTVLNQSNPIFNDVANVAGTGRLYNGQANTLTFATGAAGGYTVSGGILDVRSTAAASGIITTNGRALTINGGTLLGNSLASTSGAITLSSGILGLRAAPGSGSTAVNFTISNTLGSDGRTITMPSGGTGVFQASSLSSAVSTITIPAQASGGVWNRGTVNAGAGYTIIGGFGSQFASYSLADGSGLNGLALGAIGVPTQLTLGVGSSFFVSSSTAAARTYNVGVAGGGNDVVVPASGAFTFGVANQSTVQTINLNRDKGGDNLTLVSNGTNAANAVNIAVDQTGAGNLYVSTKVLTLNAGVTFGGTGSILTDANQGDGVAEGVIGVPAVGTVNSAGAVATIFNVNGTLNGTNSILLTGDSSSGGPNVNAAIAVGGTAVIGGTQTWAVRQTGGATYGSTLFANSIQNPANWTSGSVGLTVYGAAGTLEASTSTTAPGTSSNYRFNSLAFVADSTATSGGFKLVNNVQNDGTAAGGSEALYANTVSFSGYGDGSNGRFLVNLSGQSLYANQLGGITGLQGRGIVLQNDTLNSVSEIRSVSPVAGETMIAGGFQALNGATLQINGGNVNSMIFNRNTGYIPADTAAAPNLGGATASDDRTTLPYNAVTSSSGTGTFTSFLGSGSAAGGNTGTTATGTNGTLRVIGGNFSSSGYVLNPVGTTGVLDTTGAGDTTLNNVTFRANVQQAATVNAGTGVITLGTQQVYTNGDLVTFSATTTPGGLSASNNLTGTNYYVVNSTSTGFQIATTPGGTPLTFTSAGSGVIVADPNGASNGTVLPGLVVAGTTTVNGNLAFANAPGAANQSTLRVGGVTPGTGTFSNNVGVVSGGTYATSGTFTNASLAYTTGAASGTVTGTAVITNGAVTSFTPTGTPTTAINPTTAFGALTVTGSAATTSAGLAGIFTGATPTGTASLNVTGDLTVGSTNNLAIQSNGSVAVGGNVSIQGVGSNRYYNVTGTGVGIDPASSFTLNGNRGAATPQTVSIASGVSLGSFHVGAGSGGVLTAGGTAAQAQLLGNVSAVTGTDINGAASRLNLNGSTLTTPTLAAGGTLAGSGSVVGTVTVQSGGGLAPSSGNTTSVGLLTLSSLTVNDGAGLVFGFTGPGSNDSVAVTGVLNLAGAINVTLLQEGTANTYAAEGTYGLISYATGGTIDTGGLFVANPVPGYAYSFTNDTANSLIALNVMTAVPEPSTWVAGGLCTVFLAYQLGRRRRADQATCV